MSRANCENAGGRLLMAAETIFGIVNRDSTVIYPKTYWIEIPVDGGN